MESSAASLSAIRRHPPRRGWSESPYRPGHLRLMGYARGTFLTRVDKTRIERDAIEHDAVARAEAVMSRTGSRKPGTKGATVARWASQRLSLTLCVSEQGIERIERYAGNNPNDAWLFPETDAALPELETVRPLGRRVAYELSQALSGRPVELRVPWVPDCPRWWLAFYKEICRFRPGKRTDLPTGIIVEGKYRERSHLVPAIRKCPLLPLVPVQRIGTIEGKVVRFPWGRRWQEHLLRQERKGTRIKRLHIREGD